MHKGAVGPYRLQMLQLCKINLPYAHLSQQRINVFTNAHRDHPKGHNQEVIAEM